MREVQTLIAHLREITDAHPDGEHELAAVMARSPGAMDAEFARVKAAYLTLVGRRLVLGPADSVADLREALVGTSSDPGSEPA